MGCDITDGGRLGVALAGPVIAEKWQTARRRDPIGREWQHGSAKGRDQFLKAEHGGTYMTVAGLRSRRLAFNAEAVDVIDAESAGRWRELLGGVGVHRASLTGAGILKD